LSKNRGTKNFVPRRGGSQIMLGALLSGTGGD